MNPLSKLLAERREWRPLGLSVIVHTLLIWLLTAWFFSGAKQPEQPQVRRGGIVLAVETKNQDSEYLSEQKTLEDLAEKVSSQSENSVVSSNSPPAVPVTTQNSNNADLTGALHHELVYDAGNRLDVPPGKGMKSEFQLSPEDLKLIEADRKLIKSRQPVGEPANLSVFGSGELTGRDFVFVLDRSKSMGSSGLGVIQASRIELANAIATLEPHHHFQIVGYHDRTVTISSRRMLPATEENKALVAPFIGNLVAFGGTVHEYGLMAAIAFHPDVIVLMTDGGYPELNAGQLQLIRQMAGSKTQIHCLQFGSGPRQKTNGFMKQLAEQNRGSFRYIDVNQWRINR